MRKRSREETGMVCGIWGNFAQSTLQLASQVPGTSNLYHCLHICGLSITIEGTIQGQRGQSIDKKIFIQLLFEIFDVFLTNGYFEIFIMYRD